MELEGKRALVTGAGRGLGLAIAVLFAERGARVAVADIDAGAAEQAAGRLGEDAIGLSCDVSQAADVRRAIEDTVRKFGGLDVMVNNAGIEIGKPIPEISDEEFARLMAINVNGVFYGIKYGIGALAETRGSIINMS